MHQYAMIGREQHHRVYIQADRNALDVVDRHIARTTFDMRDKGTVQARHLPPSILPSLPQFEAPAAPVNDDFVLIRPGTTIDDAERALILRTVQLTKGNKTRAAEILGITLKTLMNKLNKYEESNPQGQ